MKKFRFLYIAAAALLFAACANEEDGIGNNGPVAATVKADISNNIKTRGTADNDRWTTGDAIGVYVTSAGNTKGTNCTTLEKVEWICTVSLRLVE